VTGAGINCPSGACTVTLASGTPVTLNAVPTGGSTLSSWTGCDSSSGTTCLLTLNQNQTVTATFAPPGGSTHTLSVSVTGTGTVTGNGISCPGTCSASLANGTPVTLSAAAGSGYAFSSWSGCDSASGTTCSLTLTADRSVSAAFTYVPPTTATLTVVNNHCTTITNLYIDGVSQPFTIAAGGTHLVTGVPIGSHTLEAYSQEGLHWGPIAYAIPAAGFTWTLSMPTGTGCVKLVNNTAYTIYHWYIQPAGNICTYGIYGSDVLGALTVSPGSSFIISNVAAGSRDFYASISGGSVYWRSCSQYVTAGTTFTWTLY
jgi:hypothetical protein